MQDDAYLYSLEVSKRNTFVFGYTKYVVVVDVVVVLDAACFLFCLMESYSLVLVSMNPI